jgi:hypothetical protein
LFNVSLYRRISFLDPAAARKLITDPVRDHFVVTPEAVEKILQITSGHGCEVFQAARIPQVNVPRNRRNDHNTISRLIREDRGILPSDA